MSNVFTLCRTMILCLLMGTRPLFKGVELWKNWVQFFPLLQYPKGQVLVTSQLLVSLNFRMLWNSIRILWVCVVCGGSCEVLLCLGILAYSLCYRTWSVHIFVHAFPCESVKLHFAVHTCNVSFGNCQAFVKQDWLDFVHTVMDFFGRRGRPFFIMCCVHTCT